MFGVFSKITQWAFSSFDICADANLVNLLMDSGVQKAMIIKRSVIFGYFVSGRLIAILLLTLLNVYLTLSYFGYDKLGYFVTSIYSLSILYWAFCALRYLAIFRRTHGKENQITDIIPLGEQLEKGDKAFGNFFDQAIVNFIILVVVAVSCILLVFFRQQALENWLYLLGIIPIIVIQFALSGRYVKRMIDLAMDFNVIVPGKILFYNQRSMWGTSQTMEADKIKTINSSVTGVLQSFFGYGDIIVLTEGDAAEMGEMSMYFVKNPKQTVLEIYKLLDGMTKATAKSVESFLEKIRLEQRNTGKICEETKKDIHIYLEGHESELKEMFELGDEVTKNYIKELYVHVEGK